jgi:hypothetical protein
MSDARSEITRCQLNQLTLLERSRGYDEAIAEVLIEAKIRKLNALYTPVWRFLGSYEYCYWLRLQIFEVAYDIHSYFCTR